MTSIDLNGATFRDKLLGCWLGKNAGGTLGAPLEEGWGLAEPFDIDWYPELPEGGIPNDDLEMQLVWLAALKQVGPGLKAQDLARYWLDHIGYNWDEYGMSKTNLRLGLQPPVSGSFNNWFIDCMGCPIRSEIWACIAPGVPRVAARYAFEDAVCDHAGGESVYGELFNVATQSAAFVVSDSQLLLDIGLSYIPPDSATAVAIRTARQAFDDGLDWKAARTRILEATPSRIAQYSPLNIGFQVLGLLYGQDFGDALCITVNSGYDTDSSGASIGSLLGIVAGRAAMPDRWLEPLGMEIATNESWGGVRHITDGTTPIPTTMDQLLDEIVTQAQIVLGAHGHPVTDGVVHVDEDALFADESIRALWDASPTTIRFDFPQVGVSIDYLDDPVVAPGQDKDLVVCVRNPHPDAVEGRVEWLVPAGWHAPKPQRVQLPAQGEAVVTGTLRPQADVADTAVAYVAVRLDGYPTAPAAPVALIGAPLWQRCDGAPQEGELPTDGDPWTDVRGRGNALPIAGGTGTGSIWMRTFLDVPHDMSVRIGLDADSAARAWLDREPVNEVAAGARLRPNYKSGHPTVELGAGWHEYLVRLEVDDPDRAPAAHLTITSADILMTGVTTIGRTRLPVRATTTTD